jgi:hypothetical protein
MKLFTTCPSPIGVAPCGAAGQFSTVICKATFSIAADGEAHLARWQEPLSLGSNGVDDFVACKPHPEVLVVGHAHSNKLTNEIAARITVGRFTHEFTARSSAATEAIPLCERHTIEALSVDATLRIEGLLRGSPLRQADLAGLRPYVFVVGAERDRPRAVASIRMRCDTLLIDTDRALVTLTWRGIVANEVLDANALFVALAPAGGFGEQDLLEALPSAEPRVIAQRPRFEIRDDETELTPEHGTPRAALPFIAPPIAAQPALEIVTVTARGVALEAEPTLPAESGVRRSPARTFGLDTFAAIQAALWTKHASATTMLAELGLDEHSFRLATQRLLKSLRAEKNVTPSDDLKRLGAQLRSEVAALGLAS